MTATLSVIVPTLNAAGSLPGCLVALMEGLHTGLIRELIVADGGSTDATLAIADEAGASILQGPPTRGGQLGRGCDTARGAWLLILHADTRLAPGWAVEAAAHIATGQGPACFRLAFDARGPAAAWVAAWANLRSRLFGLPYGDQALLVSRRDYARAGGYPDIPLMEDVALIRALPRVSLLSSRAITSADRYRRAGWLRRGARNLWTLARYFGGASGR